MLSRREALRAIGLFVVGAGAGASACKQTLPASCQDTTGLSPDAQTARRALGYADASPTPGKDCSTCQHYVAATDDGRCATCKVLQGPVHPRGYCRAYVQKT